MSVTSVKKMQAMHEKLHTLRVAQLQMIQKGRILIKISISANCKPTGNTHLELCWNCFLVLDTRTSLGFWYLSHTYITVSFHEEFRKQHKTCQRNIFPMQSSAARAEDAVLAAT